MNVLRHSGFHRVVRGEGYNPSCLACKLDEEKASVGIITCPVGRIKWQRNCAACPYCEEGGCNYLTKESLKALADDRDEKQMELQRILGLNYPCPGAKEGSIWRFRR